jgi:hypothetical protein
MFLSLLRLLEFVCRKQSDSLSSLSLTVNKRKPLIAIGKTTYCDAQLIERYEELAKVSKLNQNFSVDIISGIRPTPNRARQLLGGIAESKKEKTVQKLRAARNWMRA